MEKIYWLVAVLGAMHFVLLWVANATHISSVWIGRFFKYSAVAFLLIGWMGLIASGSNLFSFPFYPMLFLCALGYALIVSGIFFYRMRMHK